MDLIDRQYLETPFYGSRKMTVHLKGMGHSVNRKRVQRLMRLMGLEAIYPRINLSKRAMEHKKYPYLLKGLSIFHPNQVWGCDITYIRVFGGFIYLVAVLDWFSRFVLSWKISNTLDSLFCIEAVEDAMSSFGKPEIFNTDQGCQFTSDAFIKILKDCGIAISMDSKGRVFDNIMVERLWRSLKYEEIYLKGYQEFSVKDATRGIGKYFGFYNTERPHQSLGYKTPKMVFNGASIE
jgi:putative transposase